MGHHLTKERRNRELKICIPTLTMIGKKGEGTEEGGAGEEANLSLMMKINKCT